MPVSFKALFLRCQPHASDKQASKQDSLVSPTHLLSKRIIHLNVKVTIRMNYIVLLVF